MQLYVINADGTGERALTDNQDWVYWAPFWHPDGKHIVYTAADHSNPLVRPITTSTGCPWTGRQIGPAHV